MQPNDASETYHFDGEMFLWTPKSGTATSWYFIRIPIEPSAQLRESMEGFTKGFGSIRVEATVGDTVWRTSLFPDSSSKTYLLPVKKAVRKSEDLTEGDIVPVSLDVLFSPPS
jgi:Domain of unknown function (DUF1905)